jgi:hypothetical protein
LFLCGVLCLQVHKRAMRKKIQQNNTESEDRGEKVEFWASVVEMCGWFFLLGVSSFSLKRISVGEIKHEHISENLRESLWNIMFFYKATEHFLAGFFWYGRLGSRIKTFCTLLWI